MASAEIGTNLEGDFAVARWNFPNGVALVVKGPRVGLTKVKWTKHIVNFVGVNVYMTSLVCFVVIAVFFFSAGKVLKRNGKILLQM